MKRKCATAFLWNSSTEGWTPLKCAALNVSLSVVPAVLGFIFLVWFYRGLQNGTNLQDFKNVMPVIVYGMIMTAFIPVYVITGIVWAFGRNLEGKRYAALPFEKGEEHE